MKLILPILALLVFSPNPPTGSAQTLQVPRVEVGGQAGLAGAFECFCMLVIYGPRFTVNVSQQNAFELSAETLTVGEPGAYGFYFLQYKRTARRPSHWSGVQPFVTAGIGGYFTHSRIPEHRQTRQDGSVLVYPAHSTGELSGPNIATFGGGLERGLNRHIAFRFEGGIFAPVRGEDSFFGFRVLAGASVPIGGYRASTIK